MDDPGFDSWQMQWIFLSFPKIHTCSGVHPASYSMGMRNKIAEVKNCSLTYIQYQYQRWESEELYLCCPLCLMVYTGQLYL